MRKVVILDQFTGPSPYQLQKEPMPFAQLVAMVELNPGQFLWPMGAKPTVTEVPEDFRPAMATTVYAANDKGKAFVWKERWDTSG